MDSCEAAAPISSRPHSPQHSYTRHVGLIFPLPLPATVSSDRCGRQGHLPTQLHVLPGSTCSRSEKTAPPDQGHPVHKVSWVLQEAGCVHLGSWDSIHCPYQLPGRNCFSEGDNSLLHEKWPCARLQYCVVTCPWCQQRSPRRRASSSQLYC